MPMDPHARVSNMAQQEVPRAKARFKPTSPEKSAVDRGANKGPTYLFYFLLRMMIEIYLVAFDFISKMNKIC